MGNEGPIIARIPGPIENITSNKNKALKQTESLASRKSSIDNILNPNIQVEDPTRTSNLIQIINTLATKKVATPNDPEVLDYAICQLAEFQKQHLGPVDMLKFLSNYKNHPIYDKLKLYLMDTFQSIESMKTGKNNAAQTKQASQRNYLLFMLGSGDKTSIDVLFNLNTDWAIKALSDYAITYNDVTSSKILGIIKNPGTKYLGVDQDKFMTYFSQCLKGQEFNRSQKERTYNILLSCFNIEPSDLNPNNKNSIVRGAFEDVFKAIADYRNEAPNDAVAVEGRVYKEKSKEIAPPGSSGKH